MSLDLRELNNARTSRAQLLQFGCCMHFGYHSIEEDIVRVLLNGAADAAHGAAPCCCSFVPPSPPFVLFLGWLIVGLLAVHAALHDAIHGATLDVQLQVVLVSELLVLFCELTILTCESKEQIGHAIVMRLLLELLFDVRQHIAERNIVGRRAARTRARTTIALLNMRRSSVLAMHRLAAV